TFADGATDAKQEARGVPLMVVDPRVDGLEEAATRTAEAAAADDDPHSALFDDSSGVIDLDGSSVMMEGDLAVAFDCLAERGPAPLPVPPTPPPVEQAARYAAAREGSVTAAGCLVCFDS